MYSKSVALALLGLTGSVLADPTWPSPNDELEEIMYQLTSFKARKFADTISPCDNEASGPGRLNAAEWLRTGFHDMSTANTYFQTGGLDGSLQYELDNGENTGPGFKTTLEFMSNYVSPQTSLSDLIAAGVYASVRSCGGPIVPVRGGRIDAQEAGNTGVPQPQNSAFTFQQQFDRMGFNNVEMIQVTACGHTIGGVHNTEFPDIVPDANANDGQAALDSTVAVFDNNVVTEYLSGKTKNPLVVGPSSKINKNSDFKVFNIDGNKTMEALAQKDQFNQVCKTVLQKMIEVVPPGVNLTDPILPYKVKPVDVELTLADGGLNLDFSGYIRVKTTCLPKNSITDLTISYKNRQGASDCGNSGCDIKATVQGLGKGFDHTFSFFPIEAKIPVATGISSFTVTINHADGTKQIFDNNGHGYPIQDTILFQKPQSCILGSTGATTLVAAVHKDAVGTGAKAIIHYKTTQPDSPVPKLNSETLDMAKAQCIGDYTLFTVDHTIEGGMSYQSFVDLNSGNKSDSFNAVTGIGGSCFDFPNPRACSAESKAIKARGDIGRAPIPAKAIAAVTAADEPTPTTTTSTTTTTTTTSATPPPIPTHKPVVGGYTMLSCWSEGTVRALSGAATADDLMTNEKCMAFCSGYNYWGTEYGRECRF
ncbi:hypothetical protein NQ176_g6750 [Zarea fungicola]|uniref:Uncharacterized protein n=1 Tax=Zarea fungicola TaxID=93591 RepID=A0ACC1N411_9HYPO|nr:hypothetical protein NQ176_g6750 [Lecanicillium fungicola]